MGRKIVILSTTCLILLIFSTAWIGGVATSIMFQNHLSGGAAFGIGLALFFFAVGLIIGWAVWFDEMYRQLKTTPSVKKTET